MASSRDKPEKRGSPDRVGVVVLGMHRSGTSALTRVLNLLGCDLPQTLMPPNPYNEAGYWESNAIYALNERILKSAGTNWHDWLEFDHRRIKSPAFKGFRKEARARLESEFGDSSLFVLKDPRICRMVRFWADILCEADVEPRFICILRNPAEVAASLAKRDGIEVPYGHLLWLRHVLDAESYTRGRPRLFVSYDDLLTDWEKIADLARSTLGIARLKTPGKAKAEIEEFLSIGYRHHSQSHESVIGDGSLSPWLRGSYQILHDWTVAGEKPEDFAALDTFRTELNAATPAFAGLVTLGTKAIETSRHLQQSLADTEKRLGESEVTSAERSEQVKRLEQDLAEAGQKISERDDRISGLEAAHNDVKTQLDVATRATDQLRREAAERDVQVKEAKAKTEKAKADGQKALDKSKTEKAQIEDCLNERVREIATLSRRIGVIEGEANQIRQAAIAERSRVINSLIDNWHWPLLPKRARLILQAALLRRSGLFDAQWYLEEYKDVAAAKVDPACHYIQYGSKEGRHPNKAAMRAMDLPRKSGEAFTL